MSVNPFALVSSLYSFAYEVARRIAQGIDVVAVTGPYDRDELLEEVQALLPGQRFRDTHAVVSSELEAVVSHGLTTIAQLDDSPFDLNARCEAQGASLLFAPLGMGQHELAGFGMMLAADVSSKTYLSLVLQFAALVSAGSLDCYRAIVRAYADEEGSSCLSDPVARMAGYGRQRLAALLASDSNNLDRLRSFLDYLRRFAHGVPTDENGQPLDDDYASELYYWAWSCGLCTTHEGMWAPDWSVIAYAMQYADQDELAFDTTDLMEDVGLRRVSMAMTSAAMPVVERYCSFAEARYEEAGWRQGEVPQDWYTQTSRNAQTSRRERLTRASSTDAVSMFARSNLQTWQRRTHMPLCAEVDTSDMYRLRCSLCHQNPRELAAQGGMRLRVLSAMLNVLAQAEQHPHTAEMRPVFL